MPEQRVGRPLERPDHRADAPSLHQPAPAARLPQAAGTQDDVGELLRAADGHHGAEHAELARADASGEGRGRRGASAAVSARAPRRGNGWLGAALMPLAGAPQSDTAQRHWGLPASDGAGTF